MATEKLEVFHGNNAQYCPSQGAFLFYSVNRFQYCIIVPSLPPLTMQVLSMPLGLVSTGGSYFP